MRALLPALLLGISACGENGAGGGGGRVEAPVQPARSGAPAHAPEFEDAAWGRFHSQRFQLTIPLPEGRSWIIDDHKGRELVATHAHTKSRLVVYGHHEDDLMNRARCEERARALGLVPDEARLSTVERAVAIGPDAYDTGVWVAVERRAEPRAKAAPGPKADGPLTGHLFLFSAFVRRCLFVHLATEVPRAGDEAVLSSRLAVARVKLLGGIKVDPPRTGDELPREKTPR